MDDEATLDDPRAADAIRPEIDVDRERRRTRDGEWTYETLDGQLRLGTSSPFGGRRAVQNVRGLARVEPAGGVRQRRSQRVAHTHDERNPGFDRDAPLTSKGGFSIEDHLDGERVAASGPRNDLVRAGSFGELEHLDRVTSVPTEERIAAADARGDRQNEPEKQKNDSNGAHGRSLTTEAVRLGSAATRKNGARRFMQLRFLLRRKALRPFIQRVGDLCAPSSAFRAALDLGLASPPQKPSAPSPYHDLGRARTAHLNVAGGAALGFRPALSFDFLPLNAFCRSRKTFSAAARSAERALGLFVSQLIRTSSGVA